MAKKHSTKRKAAQAKLRKLRRQPKPIEEILTPKPGRRDRTFYRALQSL